MYEKRQGVLITGASGLLGSELVRELHQHYTVCALDLKPPRHRIDGVYYFDMDLTRDESVESALRKVRTQVGSRFASVVHLAAHYDFSGAPSELYEKLTVQGTRRLLENLEVQGFDVEQFVFSSTLLVMEPADDEDDSPLTEDSPMEGKWDYPRSKIEAERVIHVTAPHIPKVILRIAGVYDDKGHSPPLTNQMSRIYQQNLESLVYPGNTSHGQPFIHLKDVVACIAQTIRMRGELSDDETFLIAEPELLSYAELQEMMGELIHGEARMTLRIPKALAKAGAWVKDRLNEETFIKPWMIDLADDHYPVSIEKANRVLHWAPRYRLREQLPLMVEALKKDPVKWHEENHVPLDDSFLETSERSAHG